MIIRNAGAGDINGVYSVYLDFEGDVISYMPKKFRILRRKKKPENEVCRKGLLRDMLKNDAFFFIAEEGGEIMGYVSGYARKYNHQVYDMPLIGILDDIAVKKNFRGSGIGSKLWNTALEWFRERECTIIQLNVVEGNPARKIYEHWGFEDSVVKMRKKI